MGRVPGVFLDSVGLVRSVRLKTKPTKLIQPMTKLVLLTPRAL